MLPNGNRRPQKGRMILLAYGYTSRYTDIMRKEVRTEIIEKEFIII